MDEYQGPHEGVYMHTHTVLAPKDVSSCDMCCGTVHFRLVLSVLLYRVRMCVCVCVCVRACVCVCVIEVIIGDMSKKSVCVCVCGGVPEVLCNRDEKLSLLHCTPGMSGM